MSLERVNPVAERAMLAARNEFEIVMRVEGERHARAAFGTIWSAVKREPRWVQAACPQCENSSLAKYRALPPDSGWTLRCNPCGWSGTTPRLGPHRKDFSYASSLSNAFADQLQKWFHGLRNSSSWSTFTTMVGRISRANGLDVDWATDQIGALAPLITEECERWATGACDGTRAPASIDQWKAPIWLQDWPTPKSTPEESILYGDLRTKRLGVDETAKIRNALASQVRQEFEKLKQLGIDRAAIQMAQTPRQSEAVAPSSQLQASDRGIEIKPVGSPGAFSHSADYRSVTVRGQNFSLTARQAHVIQILYENFEQGHPDVGKDYVLESLNTANSRLRDTFKTNLEAWKALIKTGKRKGTLRLNT